ncbi:alpha/beta fold hydrolase [Flavobacterium selenitireducens]|uniref:alpha/beta fold hydrolase n=1 Tax=Flavobacterium selenitireducens TaxID=2722704 RepID=UPI00168B5C42|nr:alpha/beta hydrolase [Flavobacterium selenitireducens]MBD3583660.1 alpha/beta hydrolase [Flavobacterium selenitireducens]
MRPVLLLLTCIFMTVASCSDSRSKKTIGPAKMKIENKGVNIDYTDTKTGDTVLVFLHGWGTNKTYWEQQIPHFQKKYRVVTIDLPGFGKSGKNRETWTVEDYSRDVTAVFESLDLTNVILIGHSMSGSIVVETALQNPTRILGIVGVDNLKNVGLITADMKKEWAVFYDSARSNFKNVVSAEINGLFSPSTSKAVRQRVSNDILSSEPDIAIDCLENLDGYPFAEKLSMLDKPLWLVNSSYSATDMAALRQYGKKITLLEIGPTGHYPMLEKPDAFNKLLEEAINGIRSN